MKRLQLGKSDFSLGRRHLAGTCLFFCEWCIGGAEYLVVVAFYDVGHVFLTARANFEVI